MTAPSTSTKRFLARRGTDRRWGKSAFAWVIAAVYLFPVYWMINTSLKTPQDMFSSPPQLVPAEIYTGSYKAVFSDRYGIPQAFGNSALIALSVLVLTLVIAVPASYAVARLRGRTTTTMMIMLTVVQLLPALQAYTRAAAAAGSSGGGRCGSRLLYQRGVLLRNTIHFRDRERNLINPPALLVGGRGNLAHNVGHPRHGIDDVVHCFAGAFYQYGTGINPGNGILN